MDNPKIDSFKFYDEYYGHKVEHLKAILPHLRESCDSLIWTAGDSSLDNKYWFKDRKKAVGKYSQILDPPQSKCDVTFWLNYLAEERNKRCDEKMAAINTAVEATTLNERCTKLRNQDIFLRDNIGKNDTLIVSIGGNDVALYPTPCTIFSILGAVCLPAKCIEHGTTCCTLPIDDCCCGCGPSFLSCMGGCPPCLGYFRHFFGLRIQKYIEKICAKTKPKKILVCMIYYPEEEWHRSWANRALGALGYNRNPEKLQGLIKKMFEDATSNIKISGTEVIPIPLFNVLDGKNHDDYVARVEPSSIGGRKMAEYLLDIIHSRNNTKYGSTAAPTNSLISDR